jgi:hypothetical protein
MFFKVLWFLQSIGDKIGGETLTALGKQGEATISKLCLYDYYMLPAPTQPLSANLSLLPSYLRDQDGFFGFVGQFLHFFRFFRVSCGTEGESGDPIYLREGLGGPLSPSPLLFELDCPSSKNYGRSNFKFL